jgi:hypothetical protein
MRARTRPDHEARIVVGFVLLVVLQLLLLSPAGEFPLNDDWSHTLTVEKFVSQGRFYYPPWLSASSYVSIAVGIALSSVWGFSFELLRASNLLFGFATVALFYALLRDRGRSLPVSVGVALLLWWNPLSFNLDYTFMTDVPTLFFVVLSLFCYQRGFRSGRDRWLLAGSVASLIAGLDRQVGILPLLAAASIVAARREPGWASRLAACLAPLVAGIPLLVWLRSLSALPAEAGNHFVAFDRTFPRSALLTIWQMGLLCCFSLLPATAAILAAGAGRWRRPSLWLGLLVALLAGGLATSTGHAFPLGNIINVSGLGPARPVLQGDVPLWGNPSLYRGLNLVLFCAFGVNLHLVADELGRPGLEGQESQFLYLLGALDAASLLVVHSFDRYLLLLLPLLLIWCARQLDRHRWSRTTFAVLLLGMAAYSLIGTTNYLAWSRTRWHLGKWLLDTGVAQTDQLEGGYEWDGWYLYTRTREAPLGWSTPPSAPWWVRSLYPGHSMEYVLSFSPLAGYEVVSVEPVRGLFSSVDAIYADRIEHAKQAAPLSPSGAARAP